MSIEIKKKSAKQEKQIAKDLGGRPTPASGAMWSAKGDARSDKYLVECKITEKTFYSLTTKVWEKIRNEALRDGLRTPVMNIQLRNGANSIAVIDWHDLTALCMNMNEIQYVGNPIPEMIEAKSYRITPEFIYQPYPQNYEGVVIPRHDFKFLDVDKHSKIINNRHLVMIEWEDFLRLDQEVANQE